MKRLLMVALVLLIAIPFVPIGSAQAKVTRAPEKESTAKPKGEALGFMGKVAMIDATMIVVKGKKVAVSFDARNPTVKGYTTIRDVIVGDTIAAKYTKDGIMITKLNRAIAEMKVEKTKKSAKAGVTVAKHKGTAKIKVVKTKMVEKVTITPKKESFSTVMCTKAEPCMISLVTLTEARAVSRVTCTGADPCIVEY